MKILALDDERAALNILSRAIREAIPDAELMAYTMISEMLEILRDDNHLPDVAFLDIEMPGMTGLELARLLKMRQPCVNIVFVTGYSKYAMEAMALRPSGYVMKPIDSDQILAEIENLRNPPARTIPPKRIRVQCFGDFEIYVDGKAVVFPRAKSKEMLAFLIDRKGTNCLNTRIAAALWDDSVYDRARQKSFSAVYTDMIKALKQVNAAHIVKKTDKLFAVVPEAFDCDFYMALSGDVPSINSFLGEYMAAYSWAEFTTGALAIRFSMTPDA